MCATEDHLASRSGGGGISDSSSTRVACRPTFDKRWICMSYAFAADHCSHCQTLRPRRDAECRHHCFIHRETLPEQSVCEPLVTRKVCISAVDKHVSTLQLTARMNKISEHINGTNNCRAYVVTHQTVADMLTLLCPPARKGNLIDSQKHI